jgi:peptidoglycan/xylan/chitin deacetylase (PgdA/CDA1 family)
MTNLWNSNTPAHFWLCQPEPSEQCWQVAAQRALPVLGLSSEPDDVDQLLSLVLGEGQFGPEHWQLSLARRWYYRLKPFLPRTLTCFLRRLYSPSARGSFPLGWPIEDRYARFQWEVMRQLLIVTGQQSMSHHSFWPYGRRFAFVLTHDIETEEGQGHVRAVADLDGSFGFRSSFNFVLERYSLDHELITDLRQRGFEIGMHGLRHDGKLFNSHAEFMRRAERINYYLKQLDGVGFRSPLTMRNPEWMQALEIEYDLSFFDTDPYEPMPGGTMSIWPFIFGRFVELPYTLMQDCTLTTVLGETAPRLWLEKVDFIESYQGMVLVNTHPDYLSKPVNWEIYADFLQAMRRRGGYWHALPREVARWWRARAASADVSDPFLARVSIREEVGDPELSGRLGGPFHPVLLAGYSTNGIGVALGDSRPGG